MNPIFFLVAPTKTTGHTYLANDSRRIKRDRSKRQPKEKEGERESTPKLVAAHLPPVLRCGLDSAVHLAEVCLSSNQQRVPLTRRTVTAPIDDSRFPFVSGSVGQFSRKMPR